MKTIKLTIAALILACSFQVANAQVRVGVRIGTPPPPPQRVVVVERPPVPAREVVVVRHHRRPLGYRNVAYYRNGHRYYHRRPYYAEVVRR